MKRSVIPHPVRSGFTLIELLTVLAIIAILASIIIGTFSYANKKAFISRTKSEIAAIENALEQFKNDNGFYPQQPVGIDDRYSSTNVHKAVAGGPKVYMTFTPKQISVVTVAGVPCTDIVDAGGIAFRYLCPGTNNPATYDLWSYGPDATNGPVSGNNRSLDNIGNWQQ